MSDFEELKNKIKTKDGKIRTEQINQERADLKLNLAVKLYQKGFDDEEVERVLSVVLSAEERIDIIKKGLIGTNINPDLSKDANQPLFSGVQEIRKIQFEMQQELNATIAEIMESKKSQ